MGVLTMASAAFDRPRALLAAFLRPPVAFLVAAFLVVAFAAVLVGSVAALDAAVFLLGAVLESLAGFFALVTAFFFIGDLEVVAADLLVAADFLALAFDAGDLVAVLVPAFLIAFWEVALAAAFSAEAVLADAALPGVFFAAAVLFAAFLAFTAFPLTAFLSVGDLEALSFFAAIRGTYPLRLVVCRAEQSK